MKTKFIHSLTAVAIGAMTAGACEVESDLGPEFADEKDDSIEDRAYVTPADPLFAQQKWHYDAIRVPEAWSLTKGSNSVTVAVIDTGKMSHPDLNAKWYLGHDFYNGDKDPTETGVYHHGIHVAGTIGAAANNNHGGVGICWSCLIIPVRLASYGARIGDSPLARAIRYSAGLNVPDQVNSLPKRADVINISLGQAPSPCPTDVQNAVNAATAAGSVVVVSAGNGDAGTDGKGTKPDYDASHYMWPNCQNVIAVAAADAAGTIEPYSVRGAGITLGAPGGGDVNGKGGYGKLIGNTCTEPNPNFFPLTQQGTEGVVSSWITTNGGGCYRHFSGTSMAAPHVSGVVALMRSVNSALTVAQIKLILEKTAKKSIPCVVAGQCGAGLVDAYAAVSASSFSAEIGWCESGLGSFTCGSTTTGGLTSFTRKWEGKAYAGINNVKVTTVLTGGTCTPGKNAIVQLTVTDGLGRSVIRSKSFLCSAGPWK